MFSVTTIASSTTSPTASTTASMESTLMEKPARYITKKMPISEMGITNAGMSVTRQLRRKAKMISTTRMNAMMTVFCTSAMEALINLVLSNATSRITSSGRSFFIISMRLRTSSAISMWLAPGCGMITQLTIGTPLRRRMV